MSVRYLDRRDSYYGQDIPEHLQDDLTKDILSSARMNPDEALRIATEEQKRIQREKAQRKEDEGDFVYQIKNLEKGRKLVDQSERRANLYKKYQNRLTKRLPPSSVNEMLSRVSTMRNNGKGGRRTKKRILKNKTKRHHRRDRKNNKKRV